MKTGIFEGNAKDKPNYDVTNDNTAVIIDFLPIVLSASAPKICISTVKKGHMHGAAGS